MDMAKGSEACWSIILYWRIGTMILFLDTEFTDFQQPDLISIGLVSECGSHEFYAERNDFDLCKFQR